MRLLLLCSSSPSLSSPAPSQSPPQCPLLKPPTPSPNFFNGIAQTLSTTLLSVTLSLGLFYSAPSNSIAIESAGKTSPTLTELINPKEESNCREDDYVAKTADDRSKVVSNEEIVEEAWEIVNEGYLDTGRHRWSPDSWLKKKEDILATPIQTRSRAHDIIRKLLASLGDPYTRFLSPSDFSKMARYDITGIGINLRQIPDDSGAMKLKILGLILDGPAYSAGVRQGDELLSINGVDVKGKSEFEASSLLQGPSETSVSIMVRHGNCGPVQSFTIQRQSIAKSPVFYRLEQVKNGPGSVGYVRLKEFNALAKKDLVIALRRLQDMGASCFVLDLRNNLGGLVQAGIEIAKLFLNEGETITYTVGRDPKLVKNIVADSSPLFTAPVIVLVNNNTASASEIVATALHDNCRAVLVGEKTYGKGLIQSVFELNDGSGLVVTIGKYVTPNHVDINGNGVEPDFGSIPAWSDITGYLSKCHITQDG